MALLRLRKRNRQPSIPNLGIPLAVKPRSHSAHDLLQFVRDNNSPIRTPEHEESEQSNDEMADDSDQAQLLPTIEKRSRFSRMRANRGSFLRSLSIEKRQRNYHQQKNSSSLDTRTVKSQSQLDMIVLEIDGETGGSNRSKIPTLPRSASANNIPTFNLPSCVPEHGGDCMTLPSIGVEEQESQRRMSATFSMEMLGSELKKIRKSRRRSYDIRAEPLFTKSKLKQMLHK